MSQLPGSRVIAQVPLKLGCCKDSTIFVNCTCDMRLVHIGLEICIVPLCYVQEKHCRWQLGSIPILVFMLPNGRCTPLRNLLSMCLSASGGHQLSFLKAGLVGVTASCTEVLCVAATDRSDNLASFSNYATKYVPRAVQALKCVPTTFAWTGLLALIWLSQSLVDTIKLFPSYFWRATCTSRSKSQPLVLTSIAHGLGGQLS